MMENADVIVRIGQIAPDFEQDTTNGSIRFHEWMSRSWCILFSQPRDFTSTSTMELTAAARLHPQWSKRGVKVVALSVDSPDGHMRWEKAIEETEGLTLNFPVIADTDRTVSMLYDMVPPSTDPSAIVRRVHVIDPDKRVRLMRTYPPAMAYNFEAILRAVEGLQIADARMDMKRSTAVH
jgi:alkyl hydroperoxide reductase subunit AhpC